MAFCNSVRSIGVSALMIAALLFVLLGLPSAAVAEGDSEASPANTAPIAVEPSQGPASHEADANEEPATRTYEVKYIAIEELNAVIKTVLTHEGYTEILGDQTSGSSKLLVQDKPSILKAVDRLVAELDVKPREVLVETLIAHIELKDTAGIEGDSWCDCPELIELLGRRQSIALDQAANASKLGLGFYGGGVAEYVQAFEKNSSAKILVAPRIFVLNKQRAEMVLGGESEHKAMDPSQADSMSTPNAIDGKLRLRLRPFISADDVVRLEIHSDREQRTGRPNETRSTQWTTNVMVPDGQTVVMAHAEYDACSETDEAQPPAKKVLLMAFTPKVQK